MIPLGATLLCVIGFAALCLAMPRHQSDLIRIKLPKRASRTLRPVGLFVLLAAFACDIAARGLALGAIAWLGHLSIGAALVVASLCIRAHRRAALALDRKRAGPRQHPVQAVTPDAEEDAARPTTPSPRSAPDRQLARSLSSTGA
jgi:hypothetical protein